MQKIFEFRNDSTKLVSIILEPWAEDYHLQPSDIFSISHKCFLQGYISCIWEDQELLQVFIEGTCDYPDRITINNEEVECGHQRPKT